MMLENIENKFRKVYYWLIESFSITIFGSGEPTNSITETSLTTCNFGLSGSKLHSTDPFPISFRKNFKSPQSFVWSSNYTQLKINNIFSVQRINVKSDQVICDLEIFIEIDYYNEKCLFKNENTMKSEPFLAVLVQWMENDILRPHLLGVHNRQRPNQDGCNYEYFVRHRHKWLDQAKPK